MNYVTYGDLFTFVLMVIALLALVKDWDNKKPKNNSSVTLAS